MKLTALAGAAALALIAAPAQAYTTLPTLFAIRYCELRDIGATHDDAMRAAVRYATISSDDWIWVTVNGRQERSDVVEAAILLSKRCPHHLPK